MSVSAFHFERDADAARPMPSEAIQIARETLRSLAVTDEQMQQVTGFGLRRLGLCKPEDTVLHKFAAGALSAVGVMGAIFGSDSPQHHRGHNLDVSGAKMRDDEDATDEASDPEDSEWHP
jgi:hypothetical protein